MEIDVADITNKLMNMPFVQVDRDEFLRDELSEYYDEDVVNLAINTSPINAGIPVSKLHEIANEVKSFEVMKCTGMSFLAGLPGGMALIATVPADITQFFAFALRIVQKMMYLYGFEDVRRLNSQKKQEVLVFLGVMYGVGVALDAFKTLITQVGAQVTKKIATQAIAKTVGLQTIKEIGKQIGINITKKGAAQTVGKAIPIIGGVIAGAVSYFMLNGMSEKLNDAFSKNLKNIPMLEN